MENLNEKNIKNYKETSCLRTLLNLFEENTKYKIGYVDEKVLYDNKGYEKFRTFNLENGISWKEFLGCIQKAFNCRFVFSEADNIVHIHKIIEPKIYIKEYYIRGIYGDVYFCEEVNEEKINEDVYNCNTAPYTKFDIYLKDKETGSITDKKENIEGLPYGITEDIYYKMSTIQSLKELNKTIVLANGGTFEGTFIKKEEKEENKDIKEIVKEVFNYNIKNIFENLQLPSIPCFLNAMNNDKKIPEGDIPIKGGSDNSTQMIIHNEKAKEIVKKIKENSK